MTEFSTIFFRIARVSSSETGEAAQQRKRGNEMEGASSGGNALTHLNSDMERPRYYLTNNVMLEAALFLALTAFKAVQNLSSSQIGTAASGVAEKDLLGCFALAVLYLSTALCSSSGHLGMGYLGHKWALFISLCGYTSFTLGNVIAAAAYHNGSSNVIWLAWVAELTGALLCGISAAVLWPAHDAYSLQNAQGYAKANNLSDAVGFDPSSITSRTGGGPSFTSPEAKMAAALSAEKSSAASSSVLFSWIFFFTFQMTGVFGNLVSSVLMTASSEIEDNMYLLYLIYFFIALAGTVLAALLRNPKALESSDPLAEDAQSGLVVPQLAGRGADGVAECISGGAPVCAKALVSPFTLLNPRRRMRAVRLALCIPMMLYAGCETAYFVSHFTSTFIQPSLGAQSIGFIMMAFALGSMLASIGVGVLQGVLGHAFLLALGLICHAVVLAILLFSGDKLTNPDTPKGAVWFIELLCAFLWGTGDASLNTQLAKWLARGDRVINKAAPSTQQREELGALSSNLRMWQCLCAALAFFLDPLLPGIAATVITSVLLLLAALLFVTAIVSKRCYDRKDAPPQHKHTD